MFLQAGLAALRGVFGFRKISKMSSHHLLLVPQLRRPFRRIFGLPELVLLAAILSCARGQPPLCLEEYSKRNPQHTACKSLLNLTGLPAYGGQTVNKNIILGLMNSFRSNVALGNCKDFPSASNMLKLEWDEELFNLAYVHASYLLNASGWPFHDDVANRFTRRFEKTGQSVTRLHNATHRYVSYWNGVIKEWFSEHARLTPSSVRYYQPLASAENVTQMWWAQTGFVGCSYSTMVFSVPSASGGPDQYVYEHAYVCNFGPAGNKPAKPIYLQGPPCSRCPRGTRCEPTSGLCWTEPAPPWPQLQDDELLPLLSVAAAALAPAAALVGATAALHII
ncbi:scoloptoxin SSD976-like [Dermacentor variabilis]|uniref:scoloptoxin SSD976-like n=1 Tax=Dermacentor variabilis TaxID=34621 RepID=UPI003F5BC903